MPLKLLPISQPVISAAGPSRKCDSYIVCNSIRLFDLFRMTMPMILLCDIVESRVYVNKCHCL
jgi:hypothetical protein